MQAKYVFSLLLLSGLLTTLLGQTSVAITAGSNTLNFLTERENNAFYNYHENSKTGLFLGIVARKDETNKRNALSIVYKERIIDVSNFSGGLAGGTTSIVQYDLGYLSATASTGRLLLQKPNVFLDLSFNIELPIKKKGYHKSTTFLPPPLDQNNGITEYYDSSHHTTFFSLGPSINLGILQKISRTASVSIGWEYALVYGVGKYDFSKLSLESGFRLALQYNIEAYH